MNKAYVEKICQLTKAVKLYDFSNTDLEVKDEVMIKSAIYGLARSTSKPIESCNNPPAADLVLLLISPPLHPTVL